MIFTVFGYILVALVIFVLGWFFGYYVFMQMIMRDGSMNIGDLGTIFWLSKGASKK